MARRSRKSKQAWLLELDSDAWRIVPPAVGEETPERVEFPPETMADQAEAIRDRLTELGWRGVPLVVGLASSLCLAATVDVPAPSMLRKRQAMRFHLEGWIPWPAEEFVADFVPHHNVAFMVAVRIEPLRGLLDALEERDASPASVVPAAMLALDWHLANQQNAGSHTLLWRHDDQLELFVVRDGRPRGWRSACLTQLDDILQFVAIDALEQPPEAAWLVRGLEHEQLDRLRRHGLPVESLEALTWNEAIAQTLDAIGSGQREPLIELRRDELAGERPVQAVGPQLRRLKLAAMLAGLALCGALWLRGEQYAAGSVSLERQLGEIFEETFPKEPLPERPLAAIRKVHLLLQGTRGPVKALPSEPSCDQLLQQVLAALPNDLRYRVPEIRLEGSSIYLGGEVRSNADADRIAEALRAAGLTVDSPRTQRLAEQGFAVRLAGQLAGEKSEGKVK
jgi:hypothetical protein